MEKLHLILESVTDLQKDFIGIFFDPEFVLKQTLFFLYVLLLFYVMYGSGRVISKLFFDKTYDSRLTHFINFALGYSLISNLMFIFGLLGILTELNILIALLFLTAISIWTFIKWPIRFNFQLKGKSNWIKAFCFIFIFIALLRLIPPQTAGDPLDYHLRFPRIYIAEHTIMIPALGDESYTTVPHLPELFYILTQVVSNGLMTHVVHFGFFVLIFFLLFKINFLNKNGTNGSTISALMFVSAPLMLQLGTQAFSDFPALYCFLLSVGILLTSKLHKRNIVLSGILLGVSLASKIWILFYYPFAILFLILLLRKETFSTILKKTTLFVFSSLAIVLPWYIRAIVLVGDPFYVNTSQGQATQTYSHTAMFLRNFTVAGFSEKFNFTLEYGFFIVIGLFSLIFMKRKEIFKYKKFLLLLILLTVPVIFFPLGFGRGRYSLPYMLLAYQLAAVGLTFTMKKYLVRVGILLLFSALSLYYLFNTLVILPYGVGWANRDNFLRKNLAKDYASYYDFNGQFTRNIDKNETVTNYGVYELYYADFKYKNVFYFINQETHTFKLPRNIHKLLIRGGDFSWLCNYLNIKNCSDYKVSLITSDLRTKQYLYNIKYDSDN